MTGKRPAKIYIGIRLEVPLVKAIDTMAKRHGVSRAEEIRQLLRGCQLHDS